MGELEKSPPRIYKFPCRRAAARGGISRAKSGFGFYCAIARPDPFALYKPNPKLAGFLIRETYYLMDVPYSLIGRL